METPHTEPAPLDPKREFEIRYARQVAEDNQYLHPDNIDSSSDPLAIVLPGLFDKADAGYVRSLQAALETDCGMDVKVIDIFALPKPSIRRVANNPSDVETYNADWYPSTYMRAIKQAIDQNPNRPITLSGFSYGGLTCLLYSIIDASFEFDRVQNVVAAMPPSFYGWEGYSPSRAFDSAIGRHNSDGGRLTQRIHYEPGQPNSAFYDVRVPPDIFSRHLLPWAGMFNADKQFSTQGMAYQEGVRPLSDGSLSIGVMVPSLIASGLIDKIKANTLLIAGEQDTVVNPATVKAMHEQLQCEVKDYALLPVMHDYRTKAEQITIVNTAITDWLRNIHPADAEQTMTASKILSGWLRKIFQFGQQ